MTTIRPTLAFPMGAMMAIWSAAPALADFHLQRELGTARTSQPTFPDDQGATTPHAGSPFKLAQGFGNDVPLSFAMRQIVPASVIIRLGKGVDSAAAVSGRGGMPWNQVLAAAVRPLGFHIVTGTTTVLIAR